MSSNLAAGLFCDPSSWSPLFSNFFWELEFPDFEPQFFSEVEKDGTR